MSLAVLVAASLLWAAPCDGPGAELVFRSGVSLTVETQPIETSIVTLRSAAGFDDRARIESALRAYGGRRRRDRLGRRCDVHRRR
jgi:hypothetical protein